MVAASIMLTWIAISSASVIGLSALARAAAKSDAEAGGAPFVLEEELRALGAYALEAGRLAVESGR